MRGLPVGVIAFQGGLLELLQLGKGFRGIERWRRRGRRRGRTFLCAAAETRDEKQQGGGEEAKGNVPITAFCHGWRRLRSCSFSGGSLDNGVAVPACNPSKIPCAQSPFYSPPLSSPSFRYRPSPPHQRRPKPGRR